MIKLRFFAQLADNLGVDMLEIEHVDGNRIDDYVEQLSDRFSAEQIAEIAHGSVMLSVNHEFAEKHQRLDDGDEVGFLPPFSGG